MHWKMDQIFCVMFARLQIMISHALGFDDYVSIGILFDGYISTGLLDGYVISCIGSLCLGGSVDPESP